MPHAPAREADMLDEIVALDDVLVQRGYDDGVRVGRARGEEEGAQLGRLKGAEVGVRFAVFRGRVEAFRALSSQHPSVFPKRCARAHSCLFEMAPCPCALTFLSSLVALPLQGYCCSRAGRAGSRSCSDQPY